MSRASLALAWLILMALSLPAAAQSAAPAEYRVTDLGPLPGDRGSHAWDVNNSGVAIGASLDVVGAGRQVLFKNGTVRRIDVERAESINGRGWITGVDTPPGGGPEAYILKGDRITYLGSLGSSSWGFDINAAGHVTGDTDVGDGRRHAFIHDGRRMRSLCNACGFESSAGFAINRWDWVAGIAKAPGTSGVPFVYRGGVMHNLCELAARPDQCYGAAVDINANGWVTGVMADDRSSAGFIYDGRTLRIVTGLVIEAINVQGWVVGYAQSGRPGHWSAMLYDGKKVYDLNTLVTGAGRGRWQLAFAHGINGKGQIVGSGYPDKSDLGVAHGFLLTPVTPPPAGER